MSPLTGFVLVLLTVACTAVPLPERSEVDLLHEARTPIPILKMLNEYQPDGSYQYGYETANGISAEAKVYMRRSEDPEVAPIQVIEGSYSYIGADGKEYRVLYIADDQGYRIRGNYLAVNAERVAALSPLAQKQVALTRQQAAFSRPQAVQAVDALRAEAVAAASS